MFKCFFGHKWKVFNIVNYLDASYSEEGTKSHYIQSYCSVCKKTKRDLYFNQGYVDDDTKKILMDKEKQ